MKPESYLILFQVSENKIRVNTIILIKMITVVSSRFFVCAQDLTVMEQGIVFLIYGCKNRESPPPGHSRIAKDAYHGLHVESYLGYLSAEETFSEVRRFYTCMPNTKTLLFQFLKRSEHQD